MAKIKPEDIILTAAVRKLVSPFTAAMQSDDSIISRKREDALELGERLLDATARMTADERKAHIECFIIDVGSALVDAGVIGKSSLSDRKSMMRAMIYSAGHREAIIKAADHGAEKHGMQRARTIEQVARHVKSRLNSPKDITQKALKEWIDAKAKGAAKSKRKGTSKPLAKLNDALAWLCIKDGDYAELIADGYLSDAMLDAARKLQKEITAARLKLDAEYVA